MKKVKFLLNRNMQDTQIMNLEIKNILFKMCIAFMLYFILKSMKWTYYGSIIFSYFRYGFVTFESQDDADRIIKKEVTVLDKNAIYLYAFTVHIWKMLVLKRTLYPKYRI